nr:GntR family transcriptional regulator [Streptomyces sp. NRRL S-495]
MQIAADLAAQIASGGLAPGATVPSEAELMQRYGVASGTVRKAVALSPGAPVIHLVRDAVATDDRVVGVCDTVMAADQFVLDHRFPARD